MVRVLRNVMRGPRFFSRRVMAFDQAKLAANPSGTPIQKGLDGFEAYRSWTVTQEPRVALREHGELISVLMPTCETPQEFLREAIASVRAQSYSNWELCIYDDASSAQHVHDILQEEAAADPRIIVMKGGARGGISAASNEALKIARGKFVVLLDHDDLLHPDALAAVMAAMDGDKTDIIYSDHDCIDESSRRKFPFFKPDWSPDLFLSQMYLGHLVAIRRDLIHEVGLFDSSMDGAQDYDLILRCIAGGAEVHHISRVLYHWRQHAGSTAGNADSKPYAHHAGRAALQRYLDKVYPGAIARDGVNSFCYDVRYPVPQDSRGIDSSIIIPTRDGLDLLRTCISSLKKVTDAARYELIVVDNGSKEIATLRWLEDMAGSGVIKLIRADVPFNWSYLNNLAAEQARGDVLVFLNNDIEIIDPEWLSRLVEHALRTDVGVCGPLLLYGDMTIQHAGVVLGLGGWADHVFKGMQPLHIQSNYVSPIMRRNVLAVTGACMAIEAKKFDALGGFDESFQVCGSDVELCLRAYRRGLLNVYVPEARLIHHESKTRDPRDIPAGDFEQSERAYAPFRTEGDPYYNENLDYLSCVPQLRKQH
ncbi:glycosyltransferase family 2 protein [Dyella dinghuensis]|uniref:Glycosyltransferase family 2 protein n=2 Tax=Dyella dinghuensis TaxID=1920169 RepID=A0A432LUJ4_9GAMM|nr:glycosyltransferase family 2 protein [Dyella dinghuensis]